MSIQPYRLHADDADAEIAAAMDALRRLMRRLRLAARKTELATGLSPAQLFVLAGVVDSPGCSMSELARATMTDRSSVASVVDRLVDAGFVTRERSSNDGRRAAIRITTAGRRALRHAPPPPTALLIAALRELPERQLHRLAGGLTELTRVMGIDGEPAGLLFEETRPKAPARLVASRRVAAPGKRRHG